MIDDYLVPLSHPYQRTRTGSKLHATGLCEAVLVGALDKNDAVVMTEQQAADWLAADPRRAVCQRCAPRKPYGRLRVVR